MSNSPRQLHAIALAAAERFRDLFAGTFESWTFAGSLRRGRPTVGDVEHVVIPQLAPELEHTLMGSTPTGRTLNLFLERSEFLARGSDVQKAVYSDGKHRWGPRYRGFVFEGVRHEVFLADARNHGAILTIRTGPAEFSERLVTILKQGGIYRQCEGYIRQVRNGEVCMLDEAIVPVRTEAEYLNLCRLPWIEPEKRDAWAENVTGVRR